MPFPKAVGRLVWVPVIAISLILGSCSSGGDEAGEPTAASFDVDTSLEPILDTVAGVNGGPPRQVVSIADDNGRQADFVDRELVMVSDDQSAVNEVLERWGGEVLSRVETGLENERAYLIRVDFESVGSAMIVGPAMTVGPMFEVGPDLLVEVLETRDPDNRGQYRFSSDPAFRLMTAIAFEAAAYGHQVSANWIFYGDDITFRSTNEAPGNDGSGPTYTPDAFDWPYMNRGSAQDTGVAEAWRVLEAADRLENRVSIAILDGGFSIDADYSGTPTILPAGNWDTRNPHPCSSGADCPWHGSYVAAAALAEPDNDTMGAGSGGPVAEGIFVQMPSPDFFAFVEFALNTIPDALGRQPRIINMSASANIPAGLCIIGACGAMDLLGRTLRDNDVVVVASAGNDGADVDSEDCAVFDICWEGAVVAPCEVDGVLCVGGLAWDSDRKDPGSNFGSDSGSADSVDIYAPFGVWVGPDPDDDPEQNVVQYKTGTSFSAPFVAGVAALVRAADPSLTAREVINIILQTAHTDSGSLVVNRRINAYAAVQRALAGNVPPYVQINQPTDGGTYSIGGSVPLAATVDDDMGSPSVTWFSNRSGMIGTGSFTATTTLPGGDHIITAEVSDDTWSVLDSVSITLVNDPPTVEILLPSEGEEFFESQAIGLAGQSFDPNNRPTFDLSDAQVAWRIDGGGIFDTGHTATIPGGTLSVGPHTISFEGSDGETSVSDAVGIVVNADPVNLPPTDVEIYNPDTGQPWPPAIDIGLVDENDAMGDFKSFALYGRATDPEFGNLTGTSLQWNITSPTGTAVPSTATGTVQVVKLYIDPGETSATFTVRLTAIDVDDSNLTTSTTMLVTVRTLI